MEAVVEDDAARSDEEEEEAMADDELVDTEAALAAHAERARHRMFLRHTIFSLSHFLPSECMY